MKRGNRNIAWIETHCRIPEGKFVGQPVKLCKFQKDVIRGIYDSPTRRAIISFGRKNAKALALDTPVPTPQGWRIIGQIEPGDFVYGADGNPCQVLAVSEVFWGKPCYALGFSDGSEIVASGDHLWTTTHSFRPWAKARVNGCGNGGRERTETITTEQIAKSVCRPRADGRRESNHKLNAAPALQAHPVSLPVPPYTLGAWLGDGTTACANITVGDEDIEATVSALEADGMPVRIRRNPGRAATLVLAGGGRSASLQANLRKLGVIGNKHIPAGYFDAGTDQRWALLQGLMDTDGTVNRCAGLTTARCSFTGTSEQLTYDVWRLARSLGLKATRREGVAKLRGREIRRMWMVDFPASADFPVFRLSRKQSLLPQTLGKRSGTLTITSCEPVGSVPTKCLMVDAADSLFLVGHGCVPTHNTTLSAFLLLLHLCGPEARANSQLYSAAQSRDQAAILFSLASKIVRMSPDLSAYVGIRDTAKQLHCAELGTLYRALSAEASTAYGLSPVFTVHDELGQVKGPRSELYEALETASAAQEAPLSIIISTQAPTDADLLSLLIDDALTKSDPAQKVWLFTAPVDADPFSEKAIRAANPAFTEFMNQAEVLQQAQDAKRLPSRESSYRNLILNQRVEARSPFISRAIWLENGAEPADMAGRAVYGGLDLSSVSDLTALVLVSERDGALDVAPTFWLPGDGLAEKSRTDRVPYDVWAADGLLQTTPGASIEYEFVAEYLRGVFDRCQVQALAFDRYNMKFLRPWLERVGFSEEELARFVEFGQGFVSMSPALRELEAKVLSRKLRHGNHPVLTMCAANAVTRSDPAGNRKLNKAKATGRIDGMVALTMAVGAMPTISEPGLDSYLAFISGQVTA
jgi:phage terminase large subunit-like protein